MSKSKVPKLVKKKAKEFDKLRKALKPQDVALYLLEKTSLINPNFNVLRIVTSGWDYDYNSFFDKLTLKLATLDQDIISDYDKCSDIAINNIVYSVDDRDANKVEPTGLEPYYKTSCSRTNEIFTPGP